MKQTEKIKKESRVSIKWKIFGYFMSFALILIFLLWLFQAVLLESFYKAIKTQNLKSCAAITEKSLNQDNYESVLDDIAIDNNISIKIIDCQNFETVYSVGTIDSVIHRMRESEMYILYKLALNNKGEALQWYQRGDLRPGFFLFRKNGIYKYDGSKLDDSSDNGQSGENSTDTEDYTRGKPPMFTMGITQTLVYAKIIDKPDGTQQMIMLDSVITPIGATVKTLKIQLICISIIIFILAFTMVFIISRKISSPIMKINEAAKKLAKGDYNTNFEKDGYLEISQLSDTLNHTAVELSKAEKLQRELIANTSHDLRTPLTMIIGYSEVMRDLPGENTPENIQVIIDEATRLSRLVNDLLDMSKLQAGTEDLSLSEMNFTECVRDIVARYIKLTENDGYTIKFNSTGEVYVKADETRIKQVIYNLIANAMQYSGDEKLITVSQIIVGDAVRLEVTDTGEGIPPEHLPNIWNRYYKVDKTHKRASVGSGLGLSIVKSILDLHGARFGVNSTVGKGSTFWFELPGTQ